MEFLFERKSTKYRKRIHHLLEIGTASPTDKEHLRFIQGLLQNHMFQQLDGVHHVQEKQP